MGKVQRHSVKAYYEYMTPVAIKCITEDFKKPTSYRYYVYQS